MPDQPRRHPLTPLADFLRAEAAGGVVLLAAAIAALVWANLDPAGYHHFWNRELNVGVAGLDAGHTLEFWVNDALMVLFFFVIGLEMKRELVLGELRNRRAAILPVVAALGGMIVPAGIYLAINAGRPGAHGWGIPMATDIAFALGVLALVGRGLPTGVRLFLVTLAVADDLGAILVIAVFYGDGHSLPWLVAAVAVVVAITAMRRSGAASPWWYVLPALLLWYCVVRSGIHPTVAGVVLGLLTPTAPVRGVPVLERLEHSLHPWSSFVVVPLFALANAGVPLTATALRAAWSSRVAWGILLGLVVGKFVGVVGATALARGRIGDLPEGMSMRHVVGIGLLAGIGFTVSLFVTTLAFEGDAVRDVAKLAILGASTLAGVLGLLWFARSRRKAAPA